MTPLQLTGVSAISGDLRIPKQYARDLRRADPFIQYGVLTVHQLLAGKDVENGEWKGCGVFIGSGYGPMETNFDVLDQVVNQQQTSPTLFSHSVFNAAAGYISRIFDLRGPALSITDFHLPFFQALHQAIATLHSGRVERCVVLQIETYSELHTDARISALAHKPPEWIPGACGVLLQRTEKTTGAVIKRFSLETAVTDPHSLLDFSEKATVNGQQHDLCSPLEAAQKFCDSFVAPPHQNITFQVESPSATMELITTSE